VRSPWNVALALRVCVWCVRSLWLKLFPFFARLTSRTHEMSAAAVAAFASGVAIGLFVATKVSETHIAFTQLAKSMKKVKKTAIKKKRSRKHAVPVIYDDDYTGMSFAELRSELDDLRAEVRVLVQLRSQDGDNKKRKTYTTLDGKAYRSFPEVD